MLYWKAIAKAKCREYLNGRITQEFENGDFEFCFSVPEHETFWYGVILSLGNKVKIMEPQEMKERIIKTCKEILMEYEEEGGQSFVTKNKKSGGQQNGRNQKV